MVASLGTHGSIFGKPDQHKRRQNLDGDLVLDQRILMRGRGRLDGDESDQRLSCGIAAKYHDLHAGLLRGRGYAPMASTTVAVGAAAVAINGACGSANGTKRIVCTFDQPLLNRHVIDRGRFGPVDMELRRL